MNGGRGQAALAGIADSMHQSLAHRGPDSAGLWQDPEIPLIFAHRRLAIQDLGAGGAQPMISPSGRYVVTYNGELYNFRELQKALEEDGQIFKTRCDTEILLAAIDRWGVNHALQKFNGMYAFALWDRQARQIHFVRDRFGKKPLYIGFAGRNLVFASELKAFHAHPDFSPELDRETLAHFMNLSYIAAPRCIYKNVWQLLPAGRLTLEPAKLDGGENLAGLMEQYWQLRRAYEDARLTPVRVPEEEAVREFDSLLSACVRERMDCDVPFGSFLSGGIDSSLVTALMQKYSDKPIQTYSIGFDEDGYDESAHAAKIASHLGTRHQEFRVGAEDALNAVPSMAEIYDEPFADSSQIPTYLLSRLAKPHVTVALTGDGGDEILGGYDRHTKLPALWKKTRFMPRRTLGRLILSIPQATLDRLRPDHPQIGRKLHRFARFLTSGDSANPYGSLLEVWPQGEQAVKGVSAPAPPFADPALWPAGLDMAETMIFGDLLSYRPNDLMVKADRASMAASLETRAPLMDYRLCEYAFRLPMEMKIRDGRGKWILRRLLGRHLPPELFERPKAGFNLPVNQWLMGRLRPWAEDMLSLDRLQKQGIVDAALVHGRWRDFLEGRAAHASATDIWAMLMFQSWHDRWM